ncbi:MAG: type II toxin-antitoxin system MqsA family antitoxin [candidate division KSB1 bacterium]|nr:type II toxin-antitoxin system MqsA family antitoxin [candidate division KSB1 bacterium]MDZ7400851.1 type II toxin-antitoxin system MqsA family antitoxin [candidate division KSB1 bacterium]
MKQQKTYKCPFCGQGKMITKIIDHEIVDGTGNTVVIPNIEVDICNHCGEKFFGYEAALTLEQVKKNANQVILNLKPELYQRISSLAEKHKRSFNDEVNYLLESTLS